MVAEYTQAQKDRKILMKVRNFILIPSEEQD